MSIYLLSDKKVNGTVSLPTLQIEYITLNINLSLYDALIFTSKNALYSLNHFEDDRWKNIPSYVIAPKTASIIQQYGGNLVYTGKTNHGDSFAKELLPLLKDKKVLYLRGSKVVSSLVEILNSNNIICDESIVYNSTCKIYDKKYDFKKGSIFIFSSPSTIECFLKNFSWDESFRAISIGKTTANYFPSYINYTISDTTSLESCVKKAQELYDGKS